MNIIDSLAKRLGYTKAAAPTYPQWALDRAGVEQWTIPDPSKYAAQADLYRRISWIQIATAMPAQIAALTPLNVYKIKGEKRVDIPNHPFELLLEDPNPLQSRLEFLRDTILFWLLNANAYWFVNSTSDTQPPAELWLIPPSQIKAIPNKNSFIEGYDYDPGDGQLLRLDPWQIVHFKDFHPSSMFMGLSKTEAIAVDANADLAVSKYNAQLYGQNNGRLPGMIMFANMVNEPDWTTIKHDITNASKTNNNMLLRGTGSDVSWVQASGTIREMETYEGRQFTKEEIYSVFAPGLASMLAVNATEANSKTGKATLIEFCVYPLQVALSEKISQQLLPRYGDGLVAAFDDIRISDRALTLQEIAAYSVTHTVNEIREEHYGDPPDSDPERGALFPAQITPPAAQPAAAPGPEPTIPPDMTPMEVAPEQEEPEEPVEDDTPDEPPMIVAEKARWMRKSLNALKAGRPAAVEFETDIIPPADVDTIRADLLQARIPSQVRAVFGAKSSATKTATAEQVIEVLRLAMGALKSAEPGHPFYGNQWGGGGSGDGGSVSTASDLQHEVESKPGRLKTAQIMSEGSPSEDGYNQLGKTTFDKKNARGDTVDIRGPNELQGRKGWETRLMKKGEGEYIIADHPAREYPDKESAFRVSNRFLKSTDGFMPSEQYRKEMYH